MRWFHWFVFVMILAAYGFAGAADMRNEQELEQYRGAVYEVLQ